MGEDFEAGAVRFAAQNAAFVRVEPLHAFLACHIHAFVANAPVDAAIGADARTVHVVPGIGDVHAEAVRDDLALVGDAVVIRVAQAHEVGRDGDVNPAVVIQNACGDAGDDAVEALGEDGHLVGGAVVVGVAKLVNALAVNGEVFPVDRAVLVVIFEAAAWQAQLAGGEFAFQKGFLFRNAGERDIVGNPHRMLADVEIGDFAPRGGGNIDAALRVSGDSDGIGHVEFAGPLVKFERGLRRGFFLSGGAWQGQQRGEGDVTEFFHEKGRGKGWGNVSSCRCKADPSKSSVRLKITNVIHQTPTQIQS